MWGVGQQEHITQLWTWRIAAAADLGWPLGNRDLPHHSLLPCRRCRTHAPCSRGCMLVGGDSCGELLAPLGSGRVRHAIACWPA